MRRLRELVVRIAVAIVTCYGSWLGMLAVHELGHAAAAWITGGRVVSVSIPLLGFSQTVVHPNPRELFVVWCGPTIGTVLPLVALLVWRAFRRPLPGVAKFFGGFCAIANGAYIGAGPFIRAGDARDMLRLGTPTWILLAFGALCLLTGIVCWNGVAALSSKYWWSTPT